MSKSMLALIDRETLAKLGIDDPENPTLRVLITREDGASVTCKVKPLHAHLEREFNYWLEKGPLSLLPGSCCEVTISSSAGILVRVDQRNTVAHPVAIEVLTRFEAQMREAHKGIAELFSRLPDREAFRDDVRERMRKRLLRLATAGHAGRLLPDSLVPTRVESNDTYFVEAILDCNVLNFFGDRFGLHVGDSSNYLCRDSLDLANLYTRLCELAAEPVCTSEGRAMLEEVADSLQAAATAIKANLTNNS